MVAHGAGTLAHWEQLAPPGAPFKQSFKYCAAILGQYSKWLMLPCIRRDFIACWRGAAIVMQWKSSSLLQSLCYRWRDHQGIKVCKNIIKSSIHCSDTPKNVQLVVFLRFADWVRTMHNEPSSACDDPFEWPPSRHQAFKRDVLATFCVLLDRMPVCVFSAMLGFTIWLVCAHDFQLVGLCTVLKLSKRMERARCVNLKRGQLYVLPARPRFARFASVWR